MHERLFSQCSIIAGLAAKVSQTRTLKGQRLEVFWTIKRICSNAQSAIAMRCVSRQIIPKRHGLDTSASEDTKIVVSGYKSRHRHGQWNESDQYCETLLYQRLWVQK
jgi:hypothetical protein